MDRAQRPPRERAAEPEARGAERWIAPYFRDPTLWPVLVVAAASAATGLAALFCLAALDRNAYAAAALLALAWMSADVARRERSAHRRLGLAGRALLAVWALGAAAAVGAGWAGLF